MTERIVDESTVQLPPKLTAGFSKKINPEKRRGLPQYENEEASAYVEATFTTTNPTPDEKAAALRDAFNLARAEVYEQLGVDYEIKLDGTAVETLQTELGATQSKHQQNARAVAPREQQPHEGDSAPVDKADLWKALDEDLKDDFRDNKGHTRRFFDNRNTKTGRQPDFKVKTNTAARDSGLKSGAALWVESAPDWFAV